MFFFIHVTLISTIQTHVLCLARPGPDKLARSRSPEAKAELFCLLPQAQSTTVQHMRLKLKYIYIRFYRNHVYIPLHFF